MDHLLHRGHRVTGREALTQAGADQQITFLDVGGVGHMPQLQTLRVAGTAGDGTQTVTVHLHRDAVGGIGQQQHTRGVRHQLHHLAHQPTGIEHRLPQEHTVALTLVDQDALGEGVGVHADQLGHFDFLVDQRRGVEQLAQAHVLLGQGRQLLQATLQQQGFGLEFFVFGDKLGTAAELAGHALVQTLRQIRDPVGAHQHQRHLAAHRLQQREARIHHHQGDGQHDQHQQAHAQRGALGEKRFNKPLLPG